ncbi:MAG: fumarate hydratase, partial [Coriobacteriia bacterium]|nr:fumarate hydratase [Coriobacteriia bacterium]
MDALSSKNISSADIARVVQTHLQTIASQLRPDVLAALQQAQQTESNPAGAEVLALLVQNAQRAAQTGVPLCQDTGTVWVLIEAGSRVQTDLRDLQTKIDQVVADSFAAHLLRAS